MDSTELLDDELMIFTLLKRDLDPSVMVASELDVDSIDHLPLVTFSIRGGDQMGNGPGLWSTPLVLNVFAEGQDDTWEVCKALYRIVHEWTIPGNSTIPNVGYISSLTDLSKFSKDPSVSMQGKNVTQYTGSFDLTIRNS